MITVIKITVTKQLTIDHINNNNNNNNNKQK